MRSLCPICYKEVIATVEVGRVVLMRKSCPEHGDFTAVVESDPDFYRFVKSLHCNTIYPGMFIEVTQRCNLKCKYCYFPVCGAPDRSAAEILNECGQYAHLAPFFLTGGEPTLRDDLFDLIAQMQKRFGRVGVLTNGVKLCDKSYLAGMLEAGLVHGGVAAIGFSVHREADNREEVIENFRSLGVKVSSLQFVVDSLEEVPDIIGFYRKHRDCITHIRLKAATNLWGEQGSHSKLFVSGLLKAVQELGRVEIDLTQNNKVSFCNVRLDGLPIMLVSWYDRFNVDLGDIECPPWYLAKNGTVNNMVTTAILNEAHHGHP